MQLTRPGAILDVEERGTGRAAVVLHGMLASRRDEQAAGLDVAGRAPGRVIRYDARGHGRSTGAPDPTDYAWTALADDLLAIIEQAGGGPVDGIGSSMGVGTLLTAAVARPETFRRLVLVIPPTAWETRVPQVDGYATMARLIERKGLAALLRFQAMGPVPPAVAGQEMPPPDVTDALLPAVLRGAALSDLPPREALRRLDIPTLLLPWTDDPGHPMSTSEQLLELMPQAEMHITATPADREARAELVAEFLERSVS